MNVVHPIVEDNKSLAVPHVGMEFKSHEAAYKLYTLYAMSVGFGTKSM